MSMGFFDYLDGHAQAQAQRDAANAEQQAGVQANNMNTSQFNYGKSLLSPIASQGSQNYSNLSAQNAAGNFNTPMAGQFQYDPNNIAANPGYQFQMAQGQRALGQNASANGSVLGGQGAKQLEQFGQGLANTYNNTFYNQALGTNTQNYNQLNQQANQSFQRGSDVSQLGLGANQQLAGMAQNYAQNWGNNTVGGANAWGQGQIGANNAIGNQMNSLMGLGGNILGMGLGGYMSGLGKTGGGGGGGGGGIPGATYGSSGFPTSVPLNFSLGG